MTRPYMMIQIQHYDEDTAGCTFSLLASNEVPAQVFYSEVENMRQWCFDIMGEEDQRWAQLQAACFTFRTAADAALFKLTWG